MSQPRDPGRYYQQGPQQRYPQGPPQRGYQQRPPVGYAPPPRAPQPERRSLPLPGLGLILTLAGLVIQVLSLFVLPWVTVAGSPSMPELRDAAIDLGTHGFGAWYLVLFSYPLAALSIVLALAAVLDSVALKVVWACLALAGVGALVLGNGLLPLFDTGKNFTTQKVTTVIIALAAAAVVIFVLKSALSMFRRIAGLILIVFAGVHVAALVDLAKGSGLDELSFGAYGPALGYVLTAIAAFTAPRRIPGV
jgi:hypothetical protein